MIIDNLKQTARDLLCCHKSTAASLRKFSVLLVTVCSVRKCSLFGKNDVFVNTCKRCSEIYFLTLPKIQVVQNSSSKAVCFIT